MNKEELKLRFPFMNFDDIIMGSFGKVSRNLRSEYAATHIANSEWIKKSPEWTNIGVASQSAIRLLYEILGLENEGAIDPWQLLSAIREKNITLGVQYVKGDVEGFMFTRPHGLQDTHGFVPDEEADDANYRLRRMTGVYVRLIRFLLNMFSCISWIGFSPYHEKVSRRISFAPWL